MIPYVHYYYKIIPGKFSEHPEWAQKLAKRIQKLNIDSNSRKLTDPKRCEGYTNEYSDGVILPDRLNGSARRGILSYRSSKYSAARGPIVLQHSAE
jgi:hypothetical protein